MGESDAVPSVGKPLGHSSVANSFSKRQQAAAQLPAGKWGFDSLCNKAIDTLYARLHEAAFDKEMINLTWNVTEPGSKLRRLVVARCARRSRLHLFEGGGMPTNFCELLGRELYEMKSWISKSGVEDLGLYLCDFYEHPDGIDCEGELM